MDELRRKGGNFYWFGIITAFLYLCKLKSNYAYR